MSGLALTPGGFDSMMPSVAAIAAAVERTHPE